MHDPLSPRQGAPTLSLDDARALMGDGEVKIRGAEMAVESGDLSSEELFEGRARQAQIGYADNVIVQIRHSHHKAAMLIAAGASRMLTASATGYSPHRISILMNSPAFLELVAHYRGEEHGLAIDFVEAAQNVSMDMLGMLQQRLDEHPESFTNSMLGELIKTLADRSGNAPVARTQNLNVNVDMGTKLREGRLRVQEAERARLLKSQGPTALLGEVMSASE